MGDIFISYSNQDLDIAQRIYDALSANGFTCWFAKENVPPSGDYATQITQAILDYRYVLVIVSESSCQSEHVQREIALAADFKKEIIPFRLDDYLSHWMKYYISRVNWMFADGENMDDSIEALIDKIKGIDNLSEAPVVKHYGKTALSAKNMTAEAGQIYEIPQEEIVRIKQIAIHNELKEMQNILTQQHVLLLTSTEHTGKFTTALSLLNEMPIERLYQIFPTITENELLTMHFEPKVGYVIDGLTADVVKSLSTFSMKKLQERLMTQQSYLVMTAEAMTTLQEFSVVHEKPQSVYELLKAHYVYAAKIVELERFDELLNDYKIIEMIEKDFLPRDATLIVQKLLAVLAGEQTMAQFVQSLKKNVEQRIERLFEQEPLIDEIALILSLAIFNETAYTQLKPICDELHTVLQKLLSTDAVAVQAPFTTALGKQLEKIHAEIYEGYTNTNFGKVKESFVRYKTVEDGPSILRYVWINYPHWRAPLLEWFTKLLEKNNKQLTTRITSALTVIVQVDTPFVFQTIQAWANDKKTYYRVLAINVLNELALQKEQLVVVDKLLHYWSAVTNNSRLQWTAATAYGTNLGMYLFPSAFKKLQAIYEANVNEPAIQQIAVESMQKLFLFGRQDATYYSSVVYLFDHWLSQTKPYNAQLTLREMLFAMLENLDEQALITFMQDAEMQKKLLPKHLAEGIKQHSLRALTANVIKQMYQFAINNPSLQAQLRMMMFSFFVQAGKENKPIIFKLLMDLLKSPVRAGVESLVKELVELEGMKTS